MISTTRPPTDGEGHEGERTVPVLGNHDDSWCSVDQNRTRVQRHVPERERSPGNFARAANHGRCGRALSAVVLAQDDVRIEHLDQCGEVAVPAGGGERVDDAPLAIQVGIGNPRLALHPAAAPAGELAGRGGRAVRDRRDLVERNREHVVQHVGEPLGRG